MIQEIQRRHQQGLTLVSSCPEIRALTSAAERQFGSWSRALEVAGVEPNMQRWSKRRVIEEIQRQYHEEPRKLPRWRHTYLQVIARRFFDGWADALAAAGVIPSRDQIMGILQDHFIKGRSLEALQQRNPDLAAAARTTFGSWQKAVKAAGLWEARR